MLSSKADHIFHVWINSEAGPPKPADHPIDPHERGLYAFKAAMQVLPWLPAQIGKERRKELPLIHQQCSHSAPEAMPENYLTCGFGVRLSTCPILVRVGAKFDEMRNKLTPKGEPSYYADVTDEDIDKAKAMACVWHLLMGHEHSNHVDWNEGAIQDVSDKMFWRRVYDNLSQPAEEMPEVED